jgi:hypothetical protein
LSTLFQVRADEFASVVGRFAGWTPPLPAAEPVAAWRRFGPVMPGSLR